MLFMIVKNISVGFYKGIENFQSSDQPVTQLFTSVISHTFLNISR